MDQWIIRQEIDFAKPPEKAGKERPILLMLPGDNLAHTWEITCLNNGEAADLTNATVDGYFQRADGALVHITGTTSDNVCSLTLTTACYAIPGGLRGIVKLTYSGKVVTIADRAFWVQPDMNASSIYDGSGDIPSLPELMAELTTVRQLNNISMVILALCGLLHVRQSDMVLESVPLTDQDAYTVAVELGYTGTESDFNAFVAAVTNNTSLINQAVTTANSAASAASAAAHASTAELTVPATAWEESDGVYTATVSCSAATATNTLIIGPGPMTEEQLETMEAARIVPTAQASGAITFTCYGEVPEISLPINVLGVS